MSIVEDCYAGIVSLMGEENAPPPNYFLEVYGRMVINSFNVVDSADQVLHDLEIHSMFQFLSTDRLQPPRS